MRMIFIVCIGIAVFSMMAGCGGTCWKDVINQETSYQNFDHMIFSLTHKSDDPSVTEEDIRAVIAFAAASASEDLPAPSPIPPVTEVV